MCNAEYFYTVVLDVSEGFYLSNLSTTAEEKLNLLGAFQTTLQLGPMLRKHMQVHFA